MLHYVATTTGSAGTEQHGHGVVCCCCCWPVVILLMITMLTPSSLLSHSQLLTLAQLHAARGFRTSFHPMSSTCAYHLSTMPLAVVLMLVLSLGLLPAATHAQSGTLPPVNYTIPTFTYGPAFTSPATIAYLNTTYYAHTLPPLNLSWPVIKLAGVITLNGQYNTYATFMQQVYSFMVDLINAKGGVTITGQPHLISITWASDDSSTSMLLYLYQLWMNDPSYSLFLTPTQDQQLVQLNTLILGSNRTFFNLLC